VTARYLKLPSIVTAALWEAGMVDDSHQRLMPPDPADEADELRAVLDDSTGAVRVEVSERAAWALRWLSNYTDDMAEYGRHADDRAEGRRLRAGVDRLRARLRKEAT
jgi:hypothetical protein